MMAGAMQTPPQFGALLGQYRGGFARIVMAIAALVLFGLGVIMFLAAIGSQGVGAIVGIALVGVFFVAGGVYTLWRALASLGTQVALYEGGLSVTRRGAVTNAAWGDVRTITQAIMRQTYYGIPIWTSYSYRLTLTNGEQFVFTTTLGKIRQMGETMQRLITRELTPRAMAALQSGATLPFGKVSVSPMGISNGTATLPWNQISNVSTANGLVLIYQAGKKLRWTSARISQTPNVYVLLSVINLMRRGSASVPQAAPIANQY